MNARQKTVPKTPKARNNAAHISLQNYFDRIYDSLEHRNEEYVQMKKYMRVYYESQELLQIKKTIDMAASSIYEIDVNNKLDIETMKSLIQLLNARNTVLKNYLRGKPFSLEVKYLHEMVKQLENIMLSVVKITKNIAHINDVIPVIKALLKRKDKDPDYEHDPVLIDVASALKANLQEPDLANIKMLLKVEKVDLAQYGSSLNFEIMNDVSDKLIGLLNDKLLLIIGISEILIEGTEDDGENNVMANKRLPDELRVLFLTSSTLDVFYRTKEIRNCIQSIQASMNMYVKILKSGKIDEKLKFKLTNGENNLHSILLNISKGLQRLDPIVSELGTKLDVLDLSNAIRMTFRQMYEKANRIWENPYQL